MTLNKTLVGLIGLLVVPVCSAQDAAPPATGFVERTFSDAEGEHRYTLFVPEEYNAVQEWPIIVYLHGAGERGTDGKQPATTGPGPWLRQSHADFPFFVLFPQCESQESRLLTGWQADSPDAQRMQAILADVENSYSVDGNRRVLTGWSMGGYGVWSIAAARPDMWSAIVPISSGGDPAAVSPLSSTPVWAIHGYRDNVVRPASATAMTEALSAAGGTPWLTVVPDSGHDVWKTAYASQTLYDWMREPTNDGTAPKLSNASTVASSDQVDAFQPVLEIPGAAEIRLGNRLLKGLSYAIPSRVPRSALSGSIADIHDRTSAEGYWFNVTFAGIRYSANLAEADVRAIGNGQLQLRFGLTNVQLVLNNTYVRGSGRSAVAGPVTITIGHRRPVWLSIVVQPRVENRTLRLRTVSSQFNIESDNWWVSAPWGVSVRGFGMTRQKVANSIVRGLYQRKYRIEREVSAAVPSIMRWVEDTLDISDAGKGVAAIWPLPVYQPQVRIWPEAVRTDDQGASILLGMAAAAPTAEELPFRRVEDAALSLSTASSDATLELKVNPAAVRPLSQLLVESRAAKVNVLDIPGESFVPLVTRSQLVAAIPALRDLPDDVPIQTELTLQQPFELVGAPDDAAGSSSGALTLRAPHLKLTTQVLESPQAGQWKTIAEFDCRIEQQVKAVVSELRDASDLKLVPGADPILSVTAGQQLLENGREATEEEKSAFQGLLKNAWNEWIQGESFSDTVIADLDFKKTRLRLLEIEFAPQSVAAEFDILPIAIHNLSEEVLQYELKGPHTGWSRTYTLEPGESHQYDTDYSMTWRRQSEDGPVIYTLKPGSHSEFRVPRKGGPPRLFSR